MLLILIPFIKPFFKVNKFNVTKVGVTNIGNGRGPRHMTLIPERSLAIVVCELQNYVQLHKLDAKSSNLTMMQEMNVVSVDKNAGAEVLVHPNKQWIYISSRLIQILKAKFCILPIQGCGLSSSVSP